MMDVGRHPRIELLAYSEVEDISGYVGNFKVRVRKKARYVDESECTACGDCVPVCPIVKPDEFQMGLSSRASSRVAGKAEKICCEIESRPGAIDFPMSPRRGRLDIRSIERAGVCPVLIHASSPQ